MTQKVNKLQLLGQSDKMYSDEASLLSDCMKWLEPQRRDGIIAIKIRDRYAKGYSDVFVCVRGQLVLLELKDDTGKASPHQLDFLRDMKECGAIGGVCRTMQEISSYIEEAKRRAANWMK